MKGKIELRYQRVSDAKRLFEILNNPNFKYFSVCPKNIDDEREYLRKTQKKKKDNFEHSFSIMLNGKVVGGCGIKIDQHRKYIGEIGYFVEQKFWGKGIACEAVRILEKLGFEKLGLKRIEILMNPKNKASERVAVKCGYKKEGTKKKALHKNGKFFDAHLYAKTA